MTKKLYAETPQKEIEGCVAEILAVFNTFLIDRGIVPETSRAVMDEDALDDFERKELALYGEDYDELDGFISDILLKYKGEA